VAEWTEPRNPLSMMAGYPPPPPGWTGRGDEDIDFSPIENRTPIFQLQASYHSLLTEVPGLLSKVQI
jgi:hypothetical protein